MVSVTIDTREQDPILFPKKVWVSTCAFGRTLRTIKTHRHKLASGDYFIKDTVSGRTLLIENKDGLRELANNLLGRDRERFHRAWSRFLKEPHDKLLLLDESLGASKLPKDSPYHEAEVMRELNQLLKGNKVNVIWSGRCRTVASRIALGTRLIQMTVCFPESHLVLHED